ncbi:hypothetical protein B296_00043117 [Ensete ventricosum]|uniref:Uncharacterized protein n=1 Tax=Ensete ventricosum TaxID=4639 RepID=A0A426ZFX4_ENSVE|nr:hypothetical protein B296_00043117 [Ensete ventricosum]
MRISQSLDDLSIYIHASYGPKGIPLTLRITSSAPRNAVKAHRRIPFHKILQRSTLSIKGQRREQSKAGIAVGKQEIARDQMGIEGGTSSAATEISLAFSSASWRMNRTICWICLETSASFIFGWMLQATPSLDRWGGAGRERGNAGGTMDVDDRIRQAFIVRAKAH